MKVSIKLFLGYIVNYFKETLNGAQSYIVYIYN